MGTENVPRTGNDLIRVGPDRHLSLRGRLTLSNQDDSLQDPSPLLATLVPINTHTKE